MQVQYGFVPHTCHQVLCRPSIRWLIVPQEHRPITPVQNVKIVEKPISSKMLAMVFVPIVGEVGDIGHHPCRQNLLCHLDGTTNILLRVSVTQRATHIDHWYSNHFSSPGAPQPIVYVIHLGTTRPVSVVYFLFNGEVVHLFVVGFLPVHHAE